MIPPERHLIYHTSNPPPLRCHPSSFPTISPSSLFLIPFIISPLPFIRFRFLLSPILSFSLPVPLLFLKPSSYILFTFLYSPYPFPFSFAQEIILFRSYCRVFTSSYSFRCCSAILFLIFPTLLTIFILHFQIYCILPPP